LATLLTEQARAKINLTLRVLGRRADGYHELESLVAFADVADTVSLQPGGDVALEISGPFGAACGPGQDNLVLKAHAKLRDRVVGLQAGRFVLTKNIPVAAGLGGGSADAAAALRLLGRLNGLSESDPRLGAAALASGADVPVCLDSRARIMRGIGEQLSAPFDLPPLPALLVNPGLPLPTRDVFARLTVHQGGVRLNAEVPREQPALLRWLKDSDNDLTSSAVACLPVIAKVLAALRALPGVRLVRMSGSGPTCFALFGTAAEAQAGVHKLMAAHADWWIMPVTLSSQRP
jgi:4-diphosphocytidyl-2-C-methyl-D-erythritol kinase